MSISPAKRDKDGFFAVQACPLCGSRERRAHSVSEPNLYSEKLSELLGLDESTLIERMPNAECHECGLVYKRRWLSTLQFQRLFQEQVPTHPKGWDAISDRFRPESFFAELRMYEQALAEEDKPQIARWRRALTSIIDAIPELRDRPEREDLVRALKSGDCARIRTFEEQIRSSMNEPAPFSRFAGFHSDAMWQWCDQRVGGIDSYAEIGCPLWGMLPLARSKGAKVSFLSRSEPNYWGDACRRGKRNCVAHLQAELAIERRDWDSVQSQEYTMIGAFQYLDHLDAPGDFMGRLFEKTSACALILDRLTGPVALQHFTGWTDSAISWLASRFGKWVHDDFQPIRASGNRLYLLTDAT